MENCLFVSMVLGVIVLLVFLVQQGEKFCAPIFANYNVGGQVYNRVTKERENPRMINFDNVINEDAIAKLTDEQAEALLTILEKAGY